MPTNESDNMGLPIPVVSTTPGPDYASNLNTCLTTIDSHDHSSGNGVAIGANGINLESDLTFNNNDAIALRTSRYQVQSSVPATGSDLGCVYVSGADLYYNDRSGNVVRITSGGNVNAGAGSIGGMSGSAAVTLSAGYYVFVNIAGTAAGLSFSNAKFNSNGNVMTIAASGSLSASYTATFPAAVPASQKIMTMDSGGNIAAPYSVDASTIEISSNVIQVKDVGITTAKIANSAVTTIKIADLNVTAAKIANATITGTQIAANTVTKTNQVQQSVEVTSQSNSFTTSNTAAYQNVTNVEATITTTGRPVMVFCHASGDGTGTSDAGGFSAIATNTTASMGIGVGIKKDNTTIVLDACPTWVPVSSFVNGCVMSYPASSMIWVDTDVAGTPGTYSYRLVIKALTSNTTARATNIRMIAYEL